jgi:molybdopterin-binding protein
VSSEALAKAGALPYRFFRCAGFGEQRGWFMSQSIRNRIPGTIREMTSDKVLTEVVLETQIGPVAAVITTRSVNDLGLKVGDSVFALVKATNVSVEKE